MDAMERKRVSAWRRSRRVRNRITGTQERPRLSVFRSLRHIYAQLIDDLTGKTLCAVSTLSPAVREQMGKVKKQDAAKVVGREIAKLAKGHGIGKVAFDRGAYKYHGRVKALADAARAEGLSF